MKCGNCSRDITATVEPADPLALPAGPAQEPWCGPCVQARFEDEPTVPTMRGVGVLSARVQELDPEALEAREALLDETEPGV